MGPVGRGSRAPRAMGHHRFRNKGTPVISKLGYYYYTIMTFGIFYLPYATIMTLLLHLWLLQKFYYYDTL